MKDMGVKEIKFVFKGFNIPAEFANYANERLVGVVNTAPFGSSCEAEIELTNLGYKTTIRVANGGNMFAGTSVDSDIEKSLQRCLGQVRGKTFKWRKDKLAQKNKPRELSPSEQADPFALKKKKIFTG